MKNLLEEQTLKGQTSDDDSNDEKNLISNSMEEQTSDTDDNSDCSEINEEQLNLKGSQEDRTATRKRLLNVVKAPTNLKDNGTEHSSTPHVKNVLQLQEKEMIAPRRPLHHSSRSNKCCCVLVLLAIVISLGFVLYLLYFSTSFSTDDNQYLKNYKKKIYNKYSKQEKQTLGHFFQAIEYVNNSIDDEDSSAVVALLYSHKETAVCLAEDLAKYTAQMINNNQKFISLNGSIIDDNFSLGCDKFKNKIIENRVLVVYNFHDINDNKVKLFHGICEKYPPYVKNKAVYIVLLQLGPNQVNVSHLKKKLFGRMQELWPRLRAEFLQPLMTRIGDDVIIDVKEEKELLSC